MRRENESYWARIAHLIPDGQVKTVLDEKLCDREREIVGYVVHGFPNREIADRLCISERTVSTHLVNIYEKLNVHSRAELAAIVRATDRIIEAALRGDTNRSSGRSCIRTARSRDTWPERGWHSESMLSALLSRRSMPRHLQQFHVVLFHQSPKASRFGGPAGGCSSGEPPSAKNISNPGRENSISRRAGLSPATMNLCGTSFGV